jgi:hypothetical protein
VGVLEPRKIGRSHASSPAPNPPVLSLSDRAGSREWSRWRVSTLRASIRVAGRCQAAQPLSLGTQRVRPRRCPNPRSPSLHTSFPTRSSRGRAWPAKDRRVDRWAAGGSSPGFHPGVRVSTPKIATSVREGPCGTWSAQRCQKAPYPPSRGPWGE